MKPALALLSIGVLLSGCSAAPAPLPTTYYGQDAAAIAAMIDGCTEITAGDIGAGDGTGLKSTATCHLDGHLVNVNSWDGSASNDLRPLLKATGNEIYYAAGTGWTVTLGDDPTLQMQLENDAAGLVAQAGNATTAPNLDAQKTMAEAVAASLGGDVVHVKP